MDATKLLLVKQADAPVSAIHRRVRGGVDVRRPRLAAEPPRPRRGRWAVVAAIPRMQPGAMSGGAH
jgi:hypothetical protein